MTEHPTHPAAIDVGGQPYLRDAKGALVPLSVIKAGDLLMDELVRKVTASASSLHERLARFKIAAFNDVSEFQALLAQEYDTAIGGKRGNITLTSYDGCRKVQVQVADRFEFGPELQAAKSLIDECLSEWAADGRPEIRALVNRCFSVEKEGQINRTELFMLLRVEIHDERWQRAMQAIRESMRVIGSKSYMRFYERDQPDDAWRAISLDIAVA